MNAPLGFTALALTWLAATGAAQNPAAPVSDALRAAADRAARNLVAAAEEMPAAKYGFKPTPAQMSVGDVIRHLAQGNDYLCSKIADTPAPRRAELGKDAGKPALVARLRETFDFCRSALAKVDDSNLGAKVPFFGNRAVSRAEAMLVAVEDWADHYSQLAIYLRLNGLLPPTAQRRER